jgi:hypothetical protein
MAYGESSIGEFAIGEFAPFKPSPFPKKQAELLKKLRGELTPAQLQRWATFLDDIIERLESRGRKPLPEGENTREKVRACRSIAEAKAKFPRLKESTIVKYFGGK